MATGRFTGFGWLLGIATVSPACYMVSSQVAAERGRVESVERAIVAAQRDIRGLETEFDTRANLLQLERWNGDVLAMSAPRPDQYLAGEAALASLNRIGQTEPQLASLVVPAATDPLMPQTPAAPVAAPQPAVVPAVATVPARPAPTPSPAPTVPVASRATMQKAVAQAGAGGRVQTVAMVDSKLLSDTTFGDLVSGARAERVRLR